jgi:LysM repeat protein
MNSMRREKKRAIIVALAGGCLGLSGCTDQPDPNGTYTAWHSRTEPDGEWSFSFEFLPAESRPPGPTGKGAATYTIEEGDNAYKIAKKLGVSHGELLRLNQIDDPGKLRVGQLLKVPDRTAERRQPLAEQTGRVRYKGEFRPKSTDPERDRQLLDNYNRANGEFGKAGRSRRQAGSGASSSGDFETKMSQAFDAYRQLLSEVKFGEVCYGDGNWHREDLQLVCELTTTRQSFQPLSPGVVCRLPASLPVRAVFCIERDGDLFLESMDGGDGRGGGRSIPSRERDPGDAAGAEPPVGLRFSRQQQ